MQYENKVVLVTGAASGIGRTAALAFAREGACVAAADLDRAGGEALVAEIRAKGGRAIFVETDVTSEAAVAALVRRTVAEFGGLDAAFNNAGGFGAGATAVSCEVKDMEAILRLNVVSVMLCMKYEIPEMIKRGGGGIVNTSSRAGEGAPPNSIGYVTSKHAVVGLTRSAAIDFAPRNIRVNAVLPGPIDTPLLRHAAETAQVPLDALVQGVPMKRAGRTEEVAELVLWLCSDRCTYVTGTVNNVDGGTSATSA